MSWSTCAALLALVAASVSFGASEARNWKCRSPEVPISKNVPVCLLATQVGQYDIRELVHQVRDELFNDSEDSWGPTLRGLVEAVVDYYKPGEKVNWQRVNETITRILRVWCSDVDLAGGAVSTFEFDDNVVPICQTLIYSVEFKFATLLLKVRLLIRGAWGGKGAPPDEQKNRDCYSMCKLFRDGSTVNIAGLRARPTYLGCWFKEAQNGEQIQEHMFGNTLDCEGYNPNPNGGNGNSGGGGGSPVGWILVGLVGLALLVVVVGAAAFWFFKLRTPSTPSTASGLAESFAPSINLSKA